MHINSLLHKSHHKSNTMLDSWFEVLMLRGCVLLNMVLCFMVRHLNFGPKDIVKQVL